MNVRHRTSQAVGFDQNAATIARFEKILLNYGISRQSAARLLGVSGMTVSRWLNSRKPCPTRTPEQLKAMLDIYSPETLKQIIHPKD